MYGCDYCQLPYQKMFCVIQAQAVVVVVAFVVWAFASASQFCFKVEVEFVADETFKTMADDTQDDGVGTMEEESQDILT